MEEVQERKFGWSFRRMSKRRRVLSVLAALVLLGLLVCGLLWFKKWWRETYPPLAWDTTLVQTGAVTPPKPAPKAEPRPVLTVTAVTPTLGGKAVTETTNVMPPEPKTEPKAAPNPTPEFAPKPARTPAKARKVKEGKAIPKKTESPVEASKDGTYVWRHFGVAPYAATREVAMAKRESALRALGLPEGAVQEFLKAMEKPGEEIRIVKGDRLAVMLSKGGLIHKNVRVDFKKPPVSGMEYTAPAEAWKIVWEGKPYEVILPAVCNNWSLRIPGPPVVSASAPPVCYEIAFSADKAPFADWGIATYRGPFPPDECNAQRQGNMQWVAWYGDCPDCVPEGYREQHVPVPHHYRYPIVAREHVLRFSKEVLQSVVYLCVGEGHCGVYVRPEDWKGRHRIELSPEILDRDCR